MVIPVVTDQDGTSSFSIKKVDVGLVGTSWSFLCPGKCSEVRGEINDMGGGEREHS